MALSETFNDLLKYCFILSPPAFTQKSPEQLLHQTSCSVSRKAFNLYLRPEYLASITVFLICNMTSTGDRMLSRRPNLPFLLILYLLLAAGLFAAILLYQIILVTRCEDAIDMSHTASFFARQYASLDASTTLEFKRALNRSVARVLDDKLPDLISHTCVGHHPCQLDFPSSLSGGCSDTPFSIMQILHFPGHTSFVICAINSAY